MSRRTKPRKWIDREIASLNPETDFARIWELTSLYRGNQMFYEFQYTIGFLALMANPAGAEATFRGGNGKICQNPAKRFLDTQNHQLTWFANGPSAKVSLDSIDQVNRLHQSLAARYPEGFMDDDDYIYTLAALGSSTHRLFRQIGLAGFSKKEQQASWEFWSRIARSFINVRTGKSIGDTFPPNFDGMVDFINYYEKIERPHTIYHEEIVAAFVENFSVRYFPKGLRWIGRTMVRAFSDDQVLDTVGIKPVSPLTRKLFHLGLRSIFSFMTRVLPDPETSYFEAVKCKAMDTQRIAPAIGCPHAQNARRPAE